MAGYCRIKQQASRLEACSFLSHLELNLLDFLQDAHHVLLLPPTAGDSGYVSAASAAFCLLPFGAAAAASGRGGKRSCGACLVQPKKLPSALAIRRRV